MAARVHLYAALFVLCLHVTLTSGSGKIRIKLSDLFNPSGRDYENRCCNGVPIDNHCTQKCNVTTIHICIKDAINLVNSTVEVVICKSETSSLPVSFQFDMKKLPLLINLSIIIYNKDKNIIDIYRPIYTLSTVISDSIDTIKGIDNLEPKNITGRRLSDATSLNMRVISYCDKNFYQKTCTIKCIEQDDCDGHYNCNKTTGGEVCYDGWTGNKCTQPTHIFGECQYLKCLNGGRCISNNLKQPMCCCNGFFTGDFCEKNICECNNNGTCINTSIKDCVCPPKGGCRLTTPDMSRYTTPFKGTIETSINGENTTPTSGPITGNSTWQTTPTSKGQTTQITSRPTTGSSTWQTTPSTKEQTTQRSSDLTTRSSTWQTSNSKGQTTQSTSGPTTGSSTWQTTPSTKEQTTQRSSDLTTRSNTWQTSNSKGQTAQSTSRPTTGSSTWQTTPSTKEQTTQRTSKLTTGINTWQTTPSTKEQTTQRTSELTTGINTWQTTPSTKEQTTQRTSDLTTGINTWQTTPSTKEPTTQRTSELTTGINTWQTTPSTKEQTTQRTSDLTTGINTWQTTPSTKEQTTQRTSDLTTGINTWQTTPRTKEQTTQRTSELTTGINTWQTTPSTKEQTTQRTSELTTGINTWQTTPSTKEQTTQRTSELTTGINTWQTTPSTKEQTTQSTSKPTTGSSTWQTTPSTKEQTTQRTSELTTRSNTWQTSNSKGQTTQSTSRPTTGSSTWQTTPNIKGQTTLSTSRPAVGSSTWQVTSNIKEKTTQNTSGHTTRSSTWQITPTSKGKTIQSTSRLTTRGTTWRITSSSKGQTTLSTSRLTTGSTNQETMLSTTRQRTTDSKMNTATTRSGKTTNSNGRSSVPSAISTTQSTVGSTGQFSTTPTDSSINKFYNYTIYFKEWISSSEETVRNVTRMAWFYENRKIVSEVSKVNVTKLEVQKCLTRSGERVTEFVYSVSSVHVLNVKLRPPTASTITNVCKRLAFGSGLYSVPPRPWRYIYHYIQYILGRRQRIITLKKVNKILTTAWLNKYPEFRTSPFEIAIPLSERYLLSEGLNAMQYTYFALLNNTLLDPKRYEAPSLEPFVRNKTILIPDKNETYIRYKDVKNVVITRNVTEVDRPKLEPLFQESLRNVSKELRECQCGEIKIIKEEHFITSHGESVVKVMFRILNGSSDLTINLTDAWRNQLDRLLNSTEPFKARGNRVYYNVTEMINFIYVYQFTIIGRVPKAAHKAVDQSLYQAWKDHRPAITLKILQMLPYTGDYGSDTTVVRYVAYTTDGYLNPYQNYTPSWDVLDSLLISKSLYGVYNGIALLPQSFLHHVTVNLDFSAYGTAGEILQTNLTNIWLECLSGNSTIVKYNSSVEIIFAKPRLMVRNDLTIVSQARYFIKFNSTLIDPLDPISSHVKLFLNLSMYNDATMPVPYIELSRPYVNLRQATLLRDQLVRAWNTSTSGYSAPNITINRRNQLVNRTGGLNTRVRYLAEPSLLQKKANFNLISEYLEVDANQRLYQINLIGSHSQTQKESSVSVSLKESWSTMNLKVPSSMIEVTFNTWNNSYYTAAGHNLTKVMYNVTIAGLESSLTAVTEPSPDVFQKSSLKLYNSSALRSHVVSFKNHLNKSDNARIEKVLAISWKKDNPDFTGNITARIITNRIIETNGNYKKLDVALSSAGVELKGIRRITEIHYIIVPRVGNHIIPDEDLNSMKTKTLIDVVAKYYPDLNVFLKQKLKPVDVVSYIIIGVVVGLILLLVLILLGVFLTRRILHRRAENLTTDPSQLNYKKFDREHFASQPESPKDFKKSFELEESMGPDNVFDNPTISEGSYDVTIQI